MNDDQAPDINPDKLRALALHQDVGMGCVLNMCADALEAARKRIAELEYDLADAKGDVQMLKSETVRAERAEAELKAALVENAELHQLICGVAAAIEFDPEWDGPDAQRIREIAAIDAARTQP